MPCLQSKRFDARLQRPGRLFQLGLLLVTEQQLQILVGAGAVDLHGHAQGDVVDAGIGTHGGDGEERILVAQNGLGNLHEARCDAVVGDALELDDVVGGGAGLVKGVLPELGELYIGARLQTVLGDVDAGDVGVRPDGQLGVAVLADDVGVDVGRIEIQALAQRVSQSRRVQHGARPDDSAPGQAGHLPGHVGEHVDGVGGDQQQRVRGELHQMRHRVADDLRVAAKQVEATLARLLVVAGREDDQGSVGAVGIVAQRDARLVREGHGVVEVGDFAFSLLLVDVDEHDLRGQAAEQQGVRRCSSHMACADDDDLDRLRVLVVSICTVDWLTY